MIIDQSEEVGLRIQEQISELDQVVVTGRAKSSIEAITFIEKNKPDIILLDIDMPEINGFDILLWIRNRFSCTKVIMLTNSSGDQYRDKSMELGANYFIDKSTEFEKIPKIINEIYEVRANL